MTTQPTAKFCRKCGKHPCNGMHRGDSERYCDLCGAELVRTSERYKACPHGHGPLVGSHEARSSRVAAEDREFQRRLNEAGL